MTSDSYHRKIGGDTYFLEGWNHTKAEAQARAINIRKNHHYKVRVIPITARGKKVYATFLNKGRKK